MNRIHCSLMLALNLLLGAAALTGEAANTPPRPAPARPNIVFILVDDLRWDAFGCMGHPFVKTPKST